MLRSIGCGTILVHTRLNAGRAMIECCKPNKAISPTSMATASGTESDVGESIDRGTSRLPTNPASQAYVAKKSRCPVTP